jgi:sugar lactone lactonase YvrE
MKKIRPVLSALAAVLAALSFVPGAAAQDIISTAVGAGPNGIPAVNANINQPQQLAVDKAGNYYYPSFYQNQVFKVSTTGVITIVAGTGVRGYSGDGGQATAAELNYPQGVAIEQSTGDIYIADSSNCLVRKVTVATGIITTIAGLVNHPASGSPYPTCGFSGEGGAADAAELNDPIGLSLNSTNNDLYLAEYNNGRVRKVAGGTATGIITTIAGGGGSTTSSNNCQGSAPYGDGAAASQSYLCQPVGVVVDGSVSPANVFISDSSRCVVREVVGSTGKISLVAGTYGVCGFLDGVAANTGRLYNNYQLQIQVAGATTTVEVADYSNYRIRQFPVTLSGGVPTPGTITTIAGDGSGYSGDGGPATSAGITAPTGVVFDSTLDAYFISDSSNRVRKVSEAAATKGIITTVAGWGPNGTAITNYSDPSGIVNVTGTGPALYQPYGIFADPSSTKVYIGAYNSNSVYVFNSATSEVSNFAGNGIPGYVGDGSAATNPGAEVNAPGGIAKDSSGNIYFADSGNCVIREVAASTGILSTVAGKPNSCGYSGDNGAATSAQLNGPNSIAIDAENNIYISEYYNCSVRKVNAQTKIITTFVGTGTGSCGYNGDGQATLAELNRPQGIALDGSGNLYIADQNNHRIRKVDANFGTITTVAGDGNAGYTKDGVATAVSIYYPGCVDADANGNLFLCDTYNDIVRWVDPAGTMVTFGGTPDVNGLGGNGGAATSAMLYYPYGMAQDSGGNFYIADYNNDRIAKITPFAGYGRSTGELVFDKQGVGTTSEYQTVILSAIGPVTIDTIKVTGAFSEYDDCAGAELVAGETCEIDVYFSPTAVGDTKGLLTIASNAAFAGQGSTVNLTGTGDGVSISGSLAFGSQTLGATAAQTLTVSNSGTPVTLQKPTFATAGNFSITGGTCPAAGGVLAANSSCTIIVSYAPKTIGAAVDTLQIRSTDSLSPILVPASGNGVGFTYTPASLTFASIVAGGTETSTISITNVSTAAITLSTAISGSGASAFSIPTTGNTCGASIAAGKTCVLPVEFSPAAAGSLLASLTLTTNGGANPVIPLSGMATASVSVSPSSLAFPATTVGATSVLDLTISNSGTKTLTVTAAISGAGAADFTVLTTTANTCQSGVAAGKTCTLPMQFAPKAVASYAATLTLTTNGGANPVIALTGTGAATVVASPATLAFGTITHGTTSTMNVTVTNNGTTTIGIGSVISGTGSAAFSVVFSSANTCEAGLAPGKSCVVPIEFAPAAAASYTATLTIDAGTTNPTVTLTGTGK